MRVRRLAVGLLVVGLFVTGQLLAAPKLNQGTRQLGVSGELSDVPGGFSMNVDVVGGYFPIDNVEVGLKAGALYQSTDEHSVESKSMMLSGGGFGEYNIIMPGQPVVPYIGGGAGLGYWSSEYKSGGVKTDDSKFVFLLRGWGGAKFFIVDTLSIGCQFELDFATDEIYDDGDNMDWKIVLRTDYYF